MASVGLVKGNYAMLKQNYERALKENNESAFWKETINNEMELIKNNVLVHDPLNYKGTV